MIHCLSIYNWTCIAIYVSECEEFMSEQISTKEITAVHSNYFKDENCCYSGYRAIRNEEKAFV